uniref:Pilus assembly protein n=1 Tax=Caldilinea aerophila TaxID=133453 RepID=A0A7C1JYW0_9CHLR
MSMRKLFSDEQGQSLIQFAFMFIVLLAFAGITIEAGNVYSVRRQLQNAADAGALAGARELCMGRGVQSAIDKARDFMRRNGLNNADLALSSVSVQGNRVTVTARTHAAILIGRVLGWGGEDGTVEVGATARSACGAADSACGLWPVALNAALFRDVPCGQSVVIWDADNDKVEATCTINGQPRPVCDCYICDLDGDGADDFTVATTVARGWMDFPEPPPNEKIYIDPCKANGCGAAELACRLRNSFGGRVKLPACIPGLRGIKAGVKDDVNARAGQSVAVPLFTAINCASGSNCTGHEAQSYYVTDFGCIKVTGWIHTFRLNPKPGMPRTVRAITSKAVLATKDCSNNCVTFCGSTSGEPAQDGQLRAASLIP